MNRLPCMIQIGQRLRQIAMERGLTDADVARRVGISAERYGNYVRNIRQPDFDTLIAICKTLEVTPNHLFEAGAKEELPPPTVKVDQDGVSYGNDIYIPVPVYDMRASAGFGITTENTPTPLHANFFRLEWLRRVTSASTDHLAVVRVCGDSMWDTLHDGDHVLIDRTQTSLRKEGLFVLDVEGEVYVKRCSYRPDTRRVTMRSDNTSYPSWDGIDPEYVSVIGRVIWLGRHLG